MNLLGFGFRRIRPFEAGDKTEYVQVQQPLRRVREVVQPPEGAHRCRLVTRRRRVAAP